MIEIEMLTIPVPTELAKALRLAVETGEYENVGDAVLDALAGWHANRQSEAYETNALRRLIAEGIDSGPGLDADDVFSRLHAKYSRSAAE
jgi:antitoxin ParD1/3/4